MRDRSIRRIIIITSIVLILLLAVVVMKIIIKKENQVSGEENGGWAAESGEGAVTFDENGNRLIDWEAIQVPDWIERELLTVNEYSRPGTYLEDVAGVVVHYTANPGSSARQNRDYFEGLKDGADGTYASSHFIIDTDGTILQCIPMSEMSYASNERNVDTISIECCHEDESGKLTKATYRSLVKLVTWLVDTYKIPTKEVIRHYDVTGKACPKYYVDHEDKWEDFLKEIEKKR